MSSKLQNAFNGILVEAFRTFLFWRFFKRRVKTGEEERMGEYSMNGCQQRWGRIDGFLNNFNIMRENYNRSWARRAPSRQEERGTSLETEGAVRGAQRKAVEATEGGCGRFELPRDNIMQAVSILEWRSQTSLPILRAAHYEVTPLLHSPPQKPTFRSPSQFNSSPPGSLPARPSSLQIAQYVQSHPEVAGYELRVRAEGVKVKLPDVGAVPFSQALQLLRQMLIGFEALLDIFGAFEPREQLVAVSESDQWRMWIDEDFCSSFRPEATITEREFIYRLVLITERHSLQTVQSRLFFGVAKESTYANDCSFIKMLEKLKAFIDANRIYIPAKVAVHRQGETPTVKTPLKKLVSQPLREAPFRKRKDSCQPFSVFSKSSVNLMKPSSSTNLQLRSYPSCAELRLPASIPSSPHLADPALTFQASCDNWPAEQPDRSNTSIALRHSPTRRLRPDHTLPLNAPFPRLTSVHSTPLFNLPRPRHFRAQVELAKKQQEKPVSQLQEPVKRANIRKYSEQLVKFRSADALPARKFQASTISQNHFQTQETQEHLQLPREKSCERAEKGSRRPEETRREVNASSSSQGIIASSPNNSSSTKEFGASGEMEEAYRSLKMQDLAPHRKNNQSLIQHHLPDAAHKTMTVSYQFHRPEPPSDSESDRSSRPPPQWVNKISDLFSDTVSIKQLKGSIRFKGQEEVFEKEHLKDVKLDMLEKFGRSVTLQVEDDDQPPRTTPPRLNQYKSMQLIEEELEEVKSYQDEDRQEEAACKSIRSIRSRRQTQGDREISFKDDFLPPPDDGFNFESEPYSRRRQRSPH